MKTPKAGDTRHIEEEVLEREGVGTAAVLVLHNDDVNTFDHVIRCLVKICGHDSLQAEQCALLVHYKGRASVKTGSFGQLVPLKVALTDEGLSATIEDK